MFYKMEKQGCQTHGRAGVKNEIREDLSGLSVRVATCALHAGVRRDGFSPLPDEPLTVTGGYETD